MSEMWAIIRKHFGKLNQGQVDGINAILDASKGQPIEFRAYILATAWWETARTMQPVRETLAKTDESAVNILERAWKAGKLPTVRTPYWRFDQEGKTWLGRGYVQLTHKTNYAKASQKLGIDFLTHPNRAMEPEAAAAILVRGCVEGWFTGKKLGDYLPSDYVQARRVVNGDVAAHGQKIATTARQFEESLRHEPSSPPAPAGLMNLWSRIKAWFARR